MKKIFLILALTALMSIGVNAKGNIGTTFMAAFGMTTPGASGDTAPSITGGSRSVGSLAAGMSIISSTAEAGVTTQTPYTYQHRHQNTYKN